MFERTLQIIDEKTFKVLQSKKILLVGVGGVGSFVLEGLVRNGFLHITIIDHDCIDESNLNRQMITTRENIGNLKVEEASKHFKKINSEIDIITQAIFLNEENIDLVVTRDFDYIIDACDTITTKYLLIKKAIELNIKIISCMGTGNRFNPSKLKITSLDKTYNDPLAKVMRSILKKNKMSLKVPVIWSSEIPIKTKTRSPGSMIMVPAVAGMLINYYIIEDIKKTIC